MSEIPKAYEPQSVEDKWYKFWLDEKCFIADANSSKPAYSIVIPPPNVTGMLHMGHVLNNTIQDILARKARMDGKEVLWLPGTDHAGIATQVQVEKALKKEERLTKYDLGREEFLKRVWAWKEKHGGIIIEQLQKLGCSCDWTRERFTMDPEYSRCVQKVFVELYKKGLIYRGKRMVNWCPATQTALSDEEVDMEPQKGFLYYFKVEVAEQPGTFLTIATTRPETIPGDTAIAVNPKDTRYAHLIGKYAVRPLPIQLPHEKKLIPIIGDEYVDFEFGTGVLKVTPAHDKNDFEIGQRHKLWPVDIMNPNGSMNNRAGEDLEGLDRFEARKVAVEKLRALGALVKEEPYENKIGFSQRAKVPIEPRLSEQWFLKYPSEAQALTAVRGRDVIKFRPAYWADVYVHWMLRIQDWCISRQLWWGHRIPVWTLPVESHSEIMPQLDVVKMLRDYFAEFHLSDYVQVDFVREEMSKVLSGEVGSTLCIRICAMTEAAERAVNLLNQFNPRVPFETLAPETAQLFPTERACKIAEEVMRKFASDKAVQDPDVLDTWFSSWLWPFATMGWPEQTETLKKFYPTTDLVTGPDIIFFWVARMIMAGYEFMGEMPFRNVYFTGIIRDKQGRKMSKTLGNSPDPLELIVKYGADALRFGTMRSAPLGQDVLFDEKDVELGRNFCNKLWNACRFRQMQGGEVQGEIDSNRLTSDDKWILLKLGQAIRELTDSLAEYKFSEAAQTLYRFFWSEYCDWYVEASKAVLVSRSRGDETQTSSEESQRLLTSSPTKTEEERRANTLAVIDFVLSHTLRLFHPFLPFITEELWHGMGYHEDMPENQGGKTIMFAPWPKPFDQLFRDHYSLDDCYLDSVNAKYDLVTQGRNLRREANIPANKKVRFIFKPANELPPHDVAVLKTLLNADPLEIDANYEPKKGTPAVRAQMGELYLPLEGLIDVEAEKARLKKELEKIEAEIAKVEQKLNNPNFVQKVPAQVLQEHQQRLAEAQAKREHTKNALDMLSG